MSSLHVITSTARRGAETFAVELVAELTRVGHEARVVALTGDDDPAAHDVAVLGTSRRSPSLLTGLRSGARRADVVVAHGSATLEACAIALAANSTPFVYRTIGDPSFWVTTRARRTALGFLHRRAARHVALWQGAADQLADRYRLSRDRIDVIPNAVPGARWSRASDAERAAARSELRVEPGRRCLAFVGALSPEKDVDAVLEVARAMPEAVVLVAGVGPERARLEAKAARIDPARIRFLGTGYPISSSYGNMLWWRSRRLRWQVGTTREGGPNSTRGSRTMTRAWSTCVTCDGRKGSCAYGAG